MQTYHLRLTARPKEPWAGDSCERELTFTGPAISELQARRLALHIAWGAGFWVTGFHLIKEMS